MSFPLNLLAPASTDTHILVTEDDTLTRRFWRLVLEEEGHRVVEAADGLEALSVLATTPCWLVITDLEMPHMDGFALIRAMRRAGLRTPIIVVSGCAHSEMRQQAYRDGATLVFLKPVELTDMEQAIHRLRETYDGAS